MPQFESVFLMFWDLIEDLSEMIYLVADNFPDNFFDGSNIELVLVDFLGADGFTYTGFRFERCLLSSFAGDGLNDFSAEFSGAYLMKLCARSNLNSGVSTTFATFSNISFLITSLMTFFLIPTTL